jgi:ABC transport system ATP-binding/permease protein
MNYLSVTNLSKFYGERLLFKDLTFFIDKGQKVALIARNGSGKSTLMKIIRGLEPPESGEVKWHKDIRIGYLMQEPDLPEHMTIYQAIMNGDHPYLKACLAYERALEGEGDLDKAMQEMDRLQAWDYEVQVKQILSRFKVDRLDQKVSTLSGGQKKRLALAMLLLQEPEFLVLDEPTNHLDLDMIEWLEDYLSTGTMTLLMVTHDRYFLENICNEILELEGGQLYRHKGSFSTYLENKANREDSLRANVDKAQNTMRKELEWIRRQPKARGTKAKARVDAFEDIKDRASQKVNTEKVQLEVKMQRLGGKIIELYNVAKAYGDHKILNPFSYKFKRGERVGIVGPNGCGKSTFLNILTGKEPYDSGNLIHGETVVFGYYGQDGLQLKTDKRVIEVVKDIAEYLPIGKGQLSAAQVLERFLFDYGQQYQYASTLSGGERRRLYLLTVLMKNPNFLILDEPTNDLDIMTLQVLEDFLVDFKGCLLIVSHDRYFLDKLTEHLFVFEGEGKLRDFNGNYNEYREWLKEQERQRKMDEKAASVVNTSPNSTSKTASQKLSYKEKRELEQLDQEMAALEAEKIRIADALLNPEADHQQLTELGQRMEEIITKLDEKELRWLELSEKEG